MRDGNPTKDKHAIALILATKRVEPDFHAQTQIERTHQWAARAAAEHAQRTRLVHIPSLIRFREVFQPAPKLAKSSLTFWLEKLLSFA